MDKEVKLPKYNITSLTLEMVRTTNNMGHTAKVIFKLMKQHDHSEPAVMMTKYTLAGDNFDVFAKQNVPFVKVFKGRRLYKETYALKASTYAAGWSALSQAFAKFPEMFRVNEDKPIIG